MPFNLAISPQGHPHLEIEDDPNLSAADKRIKKAFDDNMWGGFLHLATAELQTTMSPSLRFSRDFTSRYLTQFCRLPWEEGQRNIPVVGPHRRRVEGGG